MVKKFIFLPVILFLLINFTFTSAETHYIELDSTYCNGKIQLHFPSVSDMEEPHQDTILFSDGLKLIGVKDMVYLIMTMVGDRLFFIPEDFNKWGNKCVEYPDTLTFTIEHNDIEPNNFYRNDDYIWEEALIFPDSLIPLEKLNSIINNDPIEVKAVYTSCASYHEQMMQWFVGRILLDVKSTDIGVWEPQIFYIESFEGRKFKFQLIVNDPWDPWNYDSILVLWAADSMGNGIFTNDTSHILNQNIGQNNNEAFPKFSKTKNCIYFHDIKPNTKIYLYNLQGVLMKSKRLSYKDRDVKLNFPNGMYILSVVNSKKKYSTKILIK